MVFFTLAPGSSADEFENSRKRGEGFGLKLKSAGGWYLAAEKAAATDSIPEHAVVIPVGNIYPI